MENWQFLDRVDLENIRFITLVRLYRANMGNPPLNEAIAACRCIRLAYYMGKRHGK